MAYVWKVAVVMGSDSDLPVMRGALDELDRLGLPWEARVMSAHRTPGRAAAFARLARDEGFGVIIAAAGMAAHLAGVLAGHTTLPVIGVPMRGGALDGLDALLATVQMPRGVPVATVALNGAANAAILAAQILALGNGDLSQRLAERKAAMAAEVEAKDDALQAELAKGR